MNSIRKQIVRYLKDKNLSIPDIAFKVNRNNTTIFRIYENELEKGTKLPLREKDPTTKESAIELLKDNDLSMQNIADILGVTKQRVSQIYQSEIKKGTNLPLRGVNISLKLMKINKIEKILSCQRCDKKFSALKKRKYCSYECTYPPKINWPDNLEELYKNCASMDALAKKLNISPFAVRHRLIKKYGFTKETFRQYDWRKRK